MGAAVSIRRRKERVAVGFGERRRFCFANGDGDGRSARGTTATQIWTGSGAVLLRERRWRQQIGMEVAALDLGETRRPTAAANGREGEGDGGVVAAHGRKENRGGDCGWGEGEGRTGRKKEIGKRKKKEKEKKRKKEKNFNPNIL